MRVPELNTERLCLRGFEVDEADELAAAVYSDPDAVKTLIGAAVGRVAQRELAAASIARWNRTWERHGYGVWAVVSNDPAIAPIGRITGFTGFEAPIIQGYGPEMVAARGKPYWNKRISAEVGTPALRYLFTHTDVVGVYGVVFRALNPASMRVSARVGLPVVGEVEVCDRIGGATRESMLQFEAWRVSDPATPAEEIRRSAYKTGQLVGCLSARPEHIHQQLRDALVEAGDDPVDAERLVEERLAPALEAGRTTPLPPEDYDRLGPKFVKHTVERCSWRLARAPAEDRVPRLDKALAEIGGAAAAVDVDRDRRIASLLASTEGNAQLEPTARHALIHQAVAGGIADPHLVLRALNRGSLSRSAAGRDPSASGRK